MRYLIRLTLLLAVSLFLVVPSVLPQRAPRTPTAGEISQSDLLPIIRSEDTRSLNVGLKRMLAHENPKIRTRAVLAAGRIGIVEAVPVLTEMVLTDRDPDVRRMAAFALGEIESPGGAYALVKALEDKDEGPSPVRARAIEALGKIVGALTAPNASVKPDAEWLDTVRAAIVNRLRFEAGRRSQPDRLTVLMGLTAVLRARPDGVGKLLAEFLDWSDSRIVADALNTMARLRLKEGNDKARELLVKHGDPIVRANAARVLGATEDKQAFEALLDRALHDADPRVGVSAIRALASLKDTRAVEPLLKRGDYLLKLTNVSPQFSIEPRNELLEIATTLGRLLANTNSQRAMDWLRELRNRHPGSPESEIAFARIAPQYYSTEAEHVVRSISVDDSKLVIGKKQASAGQGLTELASVNTGTPVLDASIKSSARQVVHGLIACKAPKTPAPPLPTRISPNMVLGARCIPLQTIGVPDFLRAYGILKGDDLVPTLLEKLNDPDVIVRATAAELLGDQPPGDANTRALIQALPRAMRDADNDAALAILGALAKQKNQAANDGIKTALDSRDHLIRRRAVTHLKANGVGDYQDRIGVVQTRNTAVDYRRAIARIGKKPTATVVTNKGSFTIEFLPNEAPLNVDNFLQLAKRGYFNGQTVPRVVPNFVVQAGDPRGDQNGGPGYSIRCEINEVPYERAAVGMALSGKDTGGSQWFVTHSPQPHLDGGYTVFGRVIRGMEVIDRIARGDRIVRVVVNER